MEENNLFTLEFRYNVIRNCQDAQFQPQKLCWKYVHPPEALENYIPTAAYLTGAHMACKPSIFSARFLPGNKTPHNHSARTRLITRQRETVPPFPRESYYSTFFLSRLSPTYLGTLPQRDHRFPLPKIAPRLSALQLRTLKRGRRLASTPEQRSRSGCPRRSKQAHARGGKRERERERQGARTCERRWRRAPGANSKGSGGSCSARSQR